MKRFLLIPAAIGAALFTLKAYALIDLSWWWVFGIPILSLVIPFTLLAFGLSMVAIAIVCAVLSISPLKPYPRRP